MTTVRLADLYPTWTMVPNPNRAFGEPGMLLYNENGHLVKGVVEIGARFPYVLGDLATVTLNVQITVADEAPRPP